MEHEWIWAGVDRFVNRICRQLEENSKRDALTRIVMHMYGSGVSPEVTATTAKALLDSIELMLSMQWEDVELEGGRSPSER
jgi:hypothetical protein